MNNPNLNYEQIQASADLSNAVQEIYRTARGTYIFGTKGIVSRQIRAQGIQATFVGLIYPKDMPVKQEDLENIIRKD